MNKIIAYKKNARDKLLEGCKVMYDSVGITYSPAGRNVAYGRQWGSPRVIHDGVSIAKEVQVDDELTQIGIDLIRESAQSTVSQVGDGTTLTTILTYHIVEKAMKLIDEGVNPMKLRKQIIKALPEVITSLKSLSQEVKTKEEIHHIAMVASDDTEIADAVTEAIEKVGSDGLVTVELNKKQKIETEYTEGMEIERGYGANSIFVTNPERMEAVIENTSVIILGRKVTLQQEIVLFVNAVISSGSKKVVFIGDVSGDALMVLAQNKYKGNISTVVIAVPGFGEAGKNNLEDIATLTGATVVVDEIGMQPDQFANSFHSEWIGTARKVIASRATTNIIPYTPEDFKDEASKKAIQARQKLLVERIESIRKQITETDSTYDKEQLTERLARLTTGIAVIKVGGTSEVVTNEKLERVKDAVPAVQAAKLEGIVPGGGVALLRASKILKKNKADIGEKLLCEVLQEPIRKILANSGEESKRIEEIVAEIEAKAGNFGFNVLNEKIEDLMKSGVIDPLKVIRMALENSVNIATSILTTDCVIAIKKEPENKNMMMG